MRGRERGCLWVRGRSTERDRGRFREIERKKRERERGVFVGEGEK